MADFNKMWNDFAKGAGDKAKELSSSQLWKNIIPSKEGFTQELNAYINSNQAIKATFLQDAIKAKINAAVMANVSTENADVITKEIANSLKNTKYANDDIAKIAEIMSKHNVTDTVGINEAISDIQSGLSEMLSNPIDTTGAAITDFISHPTIVPKTYFNPSDPKVRSQRIGAIAATYGTVAIGGRVLSGGSLTRDEYGRQDIAGVPFI